MFKNSVPHSVPFNKQTKILNWLEMAKVNFYLKDKNKDGSTAIVMFVSFNRQRIKYPTSKSVHPKFWNAESMRVRSVKALPEAKQINNALENLSKSSGNLFI